MKTIIFIDCMKIKLAKNEIIHFVGIAGWNERSITNNERQRF